MDIIGQRVYYLIVNVHLTPELKKLVEDEVASGKYASASEVVREGLRLLIEDRKWREEARAKLAEGLAQVKAGQLVDGEEAVARLRKRIASQASG